MDSLVLKPCPFCGSTRVEPTENTDSRCCDGTMHIECESCGAQGPEYEPTGEFRATDEQIAMATAKAIDAWNLRT